MPSCLIVEDSERVREVLVRLTGELSLEAIEADGPAAAASRLGEQNVDVILLDWDLPELGALDVLTAVAEAQLQPRPDIVLLATENEPKQFALARAAGATHYLLKPFDRSDLQNVLEKIGVQTELVA